MATDLTARGLALRGIAAAAETLVEILSVTGSGSNRTFAGTAPPNTLVTIYDNGVALGSALSNSTGAWTFRSVGLAEGAHSFTARAPVGSVSSAATISDSTPAATGFAHLPRRGFRVLSDAISLLQWGLDYGTHMNGDGAAALAANPDGNSKRDQVLRFSTAGGAGSAFVAEKLRFIAHGGNRTVSSGSDTTLAAGYWIMTLCPVSGAGQVFGAYASTTQRGEQFRIGYAASGSGFRFTVNGAAVGREIAWSKMVRLRLSWASNGALVLESRIAGEGSYTSEYTGTPNAIAAIQTLRWGLWNAAGASDVRFADVAISDTSFADIDRDWTLVGSGTRDVNQTEAAVALVIPDGMFAGMNKARLRHAAGLDPSGGSAGTWVELSGKVRNVLALALSGLSANTVYSYQIEIADSGGTVLHTSEAYRFRTLAAAGTAQAAELNFTSCYRQIPSAHPYAEEQYTLDAITANYLGTVHLGDMGYEGSVDTLFAPYIDEHPPETEAQFEQKLREFCADPVLHGLFVAGMYMATPDDHEVVNQIDATAKAGGANENTPVRFFAGARSVEYYDPATTLGQLLTRGLVVFDAWFTGHWLDTPSAGVYYQKKVLGNVELIVLDGRFENNVPAALNISSTQLTWAQGAIDAIAGTTELVIFASQTAFANYSSKEDEGWEEKAASQYAVFVDYVIANCPCNFLFVSGDDHVGYALHRKITTATNPVTPAKCLGELRASGGSVGLIYSDTTVDLSDWYYDRAGINPANAWLRSSGVLVAIAADGLSATLSVSVDGEDSSWNIGSVAPVSTRKARLTVDHNYIGANNSAGTVDAAILIARADLPDEICDPSSANKAAFIDGRDIRAKTTGGSSLAIEVVQFEYDSATGAGDANVEIWVRHTWDKAAGTEFDLFWGDTSGLATKPDGQEAWPSDALAVWHCGDVRDSTGRGRDLTLENTSFIDGPTGSALHFNGTDAQASAAFAPAAGSAARTDVMLFRARPTNGVIAYFYNYGRDLVSTLTGDRWSLVVPVATTNRLSLGIGGGSQGASSNVTDNDWHVVVVQLPSGTNTSNIDIYVDGVEESYTNVSKAIATSTATLTVGAIEDSNFANFDLAELRFYSGAISADRVATIGKTLSAIGAYVATGAPGAA